MGFNDVSDDRQASAIAQYGDGFRKYLGCSDLVFNGVVVRLRGSIKRLMCNKLLVLGLSKSEVELMQVPATENSWNIYRSLIGWGSLRTEHLKLKG